MKSLLISFTCGAVFALGLGIGGMTQPAKVIGFLDFAGNWDPSLALVMLGAVGVYAPVYNIFVKSPHACFWTAVSLPSRVQIDLRLIGGAVIFGLGWGLAGYCPGPALTSLASGNTSALIFAGAMMAGIFLFDFLRMRSTPGEVSREFRQEVTEDR
jgi:uncharacterized membrane protein YedE/YeeE